MRTVRPLTATLALGLALTGCASDPVDPGTVEAVPDSIVLTASEAEAAFAAAGCRVLADNTPLPDSEHLTGDDAELLADDLYDDVRPAHSGRHFSEWVQWQAQAFDKILDERAITHNLEHGSVLVYVAEDAPLDTPGGWAAGIMQLGFAQERAGTGIWAAPTDLLPDGFTIGLRAWGNAVDCERFDPVVAAAFVIDHFGTHGVSPEASLGPFPEDKVRYAETT